MKWILVAALGATVAAWHHWLNPARVVACGICDDRHMTLDHPFFFAPDYGAAPRG